MLHFSRPVRLNLIFCGPGASWAPQGPFHAVSTRLGALGAKISALGRVRAGGRNKLTQGHETMLYAPDNLPA